MFCIQGYSRQCKNCKLIEAKTIHGQAVTFCYIWGKTLINEKKPRTGLRLMGWERHRWLRFWGNCPIKSEISNQKRKSKKSWGQGWGWWDGSTAAARAITFSTQLGQSQPCTEFSLSPPSQRWGVSKNSSLQTICCENKKMSSVWSEVSLVNLSWSVYLFVFGCIQQNRQLSHLDIVGREFIIVPPGFSLRNARNSLVYVNIEVPLRWTKRKLYNSTCRSVCRPPPHQDPHRCSCRYPGSCLRRRRRRRGRGSSSQTRPRRAKETWGDSLGGVVFLGGNGLFRMIFWHLHVRVGVPWHYLSVDHSQYHVRKWLCQT